MDNPRYIVFKALYKVENEKSYSNLTLDSFLKNSDLSSKDSAFVSALFYGVLEKKISLDYIISKFSSVRLKKIESKTLIILRMGVYQLVFMDKIPDSAAVNEAVKLCKKERLFHSGGFVNGVLRSITRSEERFPLPDKSDIIKHLSVKYSCPEPIVKLWCSDYSEGICERILKTLSDRPPIFLRVNTLKTNSNELKKLLLEEQIESESVLVLDNVLKIKYSGALSEKECYKLGLFHIQDLSSQICCEVLDVKDGDIVSDVCSAPGGKALNLAQRNSNGRVYCYDIYEHKLKLIKSSAERLGINNIDVTKRDASSDIPLEMSDRILCDVPCSGLGIIRRKPEIAYKTDNGTDTLPEIQYRILEKSAKYLKSGGVLVYSTCTLHRAENGDVVERFLSEHNEYIPLPITLPDGVKHIVEEPENQLTLFPDSDGSDGFFIAAIGKR